jgi:hypothetical protein
MLRRGDLNGEHRSIKVWTGNTRDLYDDYPLASARKAAATGLSELTGGTIDHAMFYIWGGGIDCQIISKLDDAPDALPCLLYRSTAFLHPS